MAQYMGSTSSMAHIIQKLAIIFLEPDAEFYKVTQGNHEKVPSFATKLEGILNQIKQQCPGRMTDLEVQQHLKDCLFHGACKHIWDFIRYLYNTPGTSYLQLMVATWKAESKNEEIWDKVRARAAVTTDSGESTTELGQQIAKLMAGLTRAGQQPGQCPKQPRERGHGRGWVDRDTPGCPSSHKSWTSLGQTTPDCSTPTGCRTWATISRNQGQNSQETNARHEGTANRRDLNSLQSFRCQGWGHMAQECSPPATALHQSWGN